VSALGKGGHPAPRHRAWEPPSPVGCRREREREREKEREDGSEDKRVEKKKQKLAVIFGG